MSQGLGGSTLPSLLYTRHVSLLDWVYSLCAALLGRCSRAPAPLTHWGFQSTLGFTLAALCKVLPGPPHRDSIATHLASVALPNHGGSFHQPFTFVSVMTLEPEPCGECCRIWLPSCNGSYMPPYYIFRSFLLFLLLRSWQFLRSFLSTSRNLGG